MVRNWRPGLASGCHWTPMRRQTLTHTEAHAPHRQNEGIEKIDTRDIIPFPLWWFQDSDSDLPSVSESYMLSLISDYLLKPPVLYELAQSYSNCHGPRLVCKLSLVCDEISRQVESKQQKLPGNLAWPQHPRVWRWPHLVVFAWYELHVSRLCPPYVQWDHMWNKVKRKRNKCSSQVIKVNINDHK